MKTYIVGFDWGDVHLVTKVYANNKKRSRYNNGRE